MSLKDEACDPPKPLIIALKEIGDVTNDVVEILESHGATCNGYDGKVSRAVFTNSLPCIY